MKLSSIFSDGAIFPAHRSICVYGEGTGAVCVQFAGNTVYSDAKDGKFRVFLPPMPYGGPYELTVSDAEDTVTFRDVYVGEVYLMAGQSNMQFKLKESAFPKDEYFSDPLLRVYSTDRIEGSDVYRAKDGWVSVTRENAGEFTAIGVMMGNELRKMKNVAIGLVTCYQGASVVESWMPKTVAELPCFTIPDSEKFGDHFSAKFGSWNHAGDLYEAVFRQVVPYQMNGVVWYQGESDASDGEARIYKDELLAMIDVWRSDLLDPTLPFYIVQLADCDSRSWPCWRAIQQAQADAANDEKKIYCVVCRDVCESSTIHPTQKAELSRRLAEMICEAE